MDRVHKFMDRVHKLYYPNRGIILSQSYRFLILLLQIVVIMFHCSLLRIFYFLLILDNVVSGGKLIEE